MQNSRQKGWVGSSSPSSPPRQGEGRREANLVVGGTCEWEPFISAVQHRAVNPLLHWVWVWLCFCGQDGPGKLGYVLGVSRGVMEPAVASTPMPTGSSCVLFWACPWSPDVAVSGHQLCPFLSLSVLHFLPSVGSQGRPWGVHNNNYHQSGLKNDTQSV